MEEHELKESEDAHLWIKDHRKDLIKKFVPENTPTDSYPTTIFMAGSPGAGKTKFSRRLAESFKEKPVIIDADEIRKFVSGYKGKKAYIFQKAATKGVNILYDYACKMGLNIILDGTFAYNDALGNIDHSLKHNRNVEIYFLYQDPLLSWAYTKKRELKEFRNVPKKVFIKAYIKSIDNVNNAKKLYGNKIKLNIVVKNFQQNLDALELNKDKVDYYIKRMYTTIELEKLLD